ncbi:MAG: GNAT family N-acetyltransferase [Thermomicrobiales bacterium]
MAVFPLLAGLISLVCTGVAGWRYWRRRRPHELAWSIAFALFALAALAEVAGDFFGWSAWLARIYFVSGAILTVGFLGIGSLYLLVNRWMTRWGPGLMLGISALSVALVINTPVDASKLPQGWDALQRQGTATEVWTIVVNAVGSLIVIGGALYSVWAGWRRGMPRHRAMGLVLIAVGTLLVASGASFYKLLGNHAYLYVPMAPGVAIILAGYLLTNRAGRGAPSMPAPVAAPVVTAPANAGSPVAQTANVAAVAAPAVTAPSNGAATAPAIRSTPARRPRRVAPRDLTVRLLNADDAPLVRALLGCGVAASPLAAGARYLPDAALEAALLEDVWFGALRDGALLGLARAQLGAQPATRHTAHLDLFAVRPDAVGQGIGAALLDAVLAWTDDHLGLVRLDLWLCAGDDRVCQFFTRAGFAPEGTLRAALFQEGQHRAVTLLARVREPGAD